MLHEGLHECHNFSQKYHPAATNCNKIAYFACSNISD